MDTKRMLPAGGVNIVVSAACVSIYALGGQNSTWAVLAILNMLVAIWAKLDG